MSLDHLRSVEREIKETVTATAQENRVTDNDLNWNGTGGIPWVHLPSIYPSALPPMDEECLLNYLYQTSIKRSDLIDVMTTEGLYLVNKRFYTWLQKQIDLDCQLVGNTLLNYFKTQQFAKSSVSISSMSMTAVVTSSAVRDDGDDDVDDNAGGGGKEKRGKKNKKSGNAGGGGGGGGGKKSESKKKVSKTNQQSDSLETTSHSSVLAALAPYLDDHRLIGLLREWCQPIVDFSEGRVRSDSQSLDGDEVSDPDGTDDLLMPLYVGLWEIFKDTSQDHYKAVAIRAKDEASQVTLSSFALPFLCADGHCVQGGSTDRMKKEQERDRKFEVMWNELQIAIKGLAALENRSGMLLEHS